MSRATAQATGLLFSIGYSQADATASIDVRDGVRIEANGPINLTSSASAIASMTTVTAHQDSLASTAVRKISPQAGTSIAVSNARLSSTATVAETAVIHGGRTVNVRALGEVESVAEATSGLFADGAALITLSWSGTTRRNLMKLTGERGEIELADDRLVIRNEGHDATTVFERALSHGSHHDDWFAAMLPDVVACFKDAPRARAAFDEARACLKVIREAYRGALLSAST